MQHRILVVDDEETAREELCEALADAGFAAQGAGTAEAALEAARETTFDVCISDIRMPGMDGIELLRRLGEASPETIVVIVTAYGDLKTSIAALQGGAADYILKPILFEEILTKLRRLMEHRSLALQVRNLRRILATTGRGEPLVGKSPALREARDLITQVAPSRSPILIRGKSGVGKRHLARAVHAASRQADEPFVVVHCAASSETMLESELFGHAAGFFGEAMGEREGLLSTVGGGTLALVEVASMPAAVQARLSAALEHREASPLGSRRRYPIAARLLAATRTDLKAEVAAGRFREDLYYRLAVVEIELPPLAERRGDIPLLVEHFLEKYNRELGKGFTGPSEAALAQLRSYDWPGNLRELKNVLEGVLIVAPGPAVIELRDLPEVVRAAPLVEEDVLPEKIGPYRVDGRLGIGGMSEVYCGWDEKLLRTVAIKRVQDDLAANPEKRERLRREARAVARLSHPAIVQVYHLLEEEGHDYIVMELIEGEPLTELLRGEPLDGQQALALAREVTGGLEEAHFHGLVHRDLKTENVLVTTSGHAKILDFGLALSHADDNPPLTRDGDICGTCHAMSPEQATGAAIDHRSDLFSFGSLLYEATTGVAPFAAASPVATMMQVVRHEPPPARVFNPRIPDELSQLIERLMEKDPADRPQTAQDVGLVLDQITGSGAGNRELKRRVLEAVARSEGHFRDLGSPSAAVAVPAEPPAGAPEKREATGGLRHFLGELWRTVAGRS